MMLSGLEPVAIGTGSLFVNIGERTNVTGSKAFARMILNGKFEEALAVANGVDVGLSASIVTRDLKKAMLYTERIEAGVVKVNQISTGLALQAPFGGVKKSSTDSFMAGTWGAGIASHLLGVGPG